MTCHKKIGVWFGNNVAKKDKSTQQKSKQKPFTIRDVIKNTHKDQVLGLIAEKTDAPVGNKEWLPHYPGALTQVIENLTAEEMATAEAALDEWNENGVPREVQRQ
jgi:hypothetical protein